MPAIYLLIREHNITRGGPAFACEQHTINMAKTSSGQISASPEVFHLPTTRFPSVTKHGAETTLATDQASTCATEPFSSRNKQKFIKISYFSAKPPQQAFKYLCTVSVSAMWFELYYAHLIEASRASGIVGAATPPVSTHPSRTFFKTISLDGIPDTFSR